jgi:hypothetical protein
MPFEFSEQEIEAPIHIRARSPFQGHGTGELDLRRCLAGSASMDEEQSTSGHTATESSQTAKSFSKWLRHNIYVFRFGECLASRFQKI